MIKNHSINKGNILMDKMTQLIGLEKMYKIYL